MYPFSVARANRPKKKCHTANMTAGSRESGSGTRNPHKYLPLASRNPPKTSLERKQSSEQPTHCFLFPPLPPHMTSDFCERRAKISQNSPKCVCECEDCAQQSNRFYGVRV